MTTISNLDDAAAKVLSMYHELKSKRKSKKEKLMDGAIKKVYELWGRDAKYELETFRSAVLTKINGWRKNKKQFLVTIAKTKTSAAAKAEQLTLFVPDPVKKVVRKIKRKPGFEFLSFATH